jgi:hypothetical protein
MVEVVLKKVSKFSATGVALLMSVIKIAYQPKYLIMKMIIMFQVWGRR